MCSSDLRLLGQFARAVALSNVDAAAIQAQVPQLPVDVVASGIDVDSVRPGAEVAEDAHTIVFVGHYKHAPNVDAAIWLAQEILPRVRASIPAAKVRLVGSSAPAAVEALASEHVEVAGFVPDLGEVLARATVVALPLRLGGGMRGKLLEAWAAGRPVVATPVALEGYRAQDGEHVLIAADADAFSAALVRCLREPELRRRLGAGGRSLCCEHHSVAAAAASFDRIYDELLGAAR